MVRKVDALHIGFMQGRLCAHFVPNENRYRYGARQRADYDDDSRISQ